MVLFIHSLLAVSVLSASFPGTHASPPAGRVGENYASRLDHVAAWSGFPLKVYFEHDGQYSREREECARTGFRNWTEATAGAACFVYVDNPEDAQVRVNFVSGNRNGATTTRMRKGLLLEARISLGAEVGPGPDMEYIAAHEMGHALGLGGHSENRRDLMFDYHISGRAYRITERDLATFAVAYPRLATRGSAR